MSKKLDIPNDPWNNAIYNSGLEWAAAWIESSLTGETNERTIEFARNMAMSIRAARKPTDFQVDFFDAIRNDPSMSPENKRYWLSLEEQKSEATQ